MNKKQMKTIGSLNKEIEDKKNHMEILGLKNTVTEIKNSLDELHNRREGTEERICEFENRTIEITQSEQ